jgi:hypothetical protein
MEIKAHTRRASGERDEILEGLPVAPRYERLETRPVDRERQEQLSSPAGGGPERDRAHGDES